jgi:single-strand DNA-binding protein
MQGNFSVTLLGRLTRDPQLKFLPNQTPVVEFGMAASRKYKGQDGEQREERCFVDVSAFGKQAEVINKFVKKGDKFFVTGRLKMDEWTKDGEKKTKLSVVADGFDFVENKEKSEDPF